MPKPLVCEAVRADSVIEIRCGPPAENSRWEWWARTNADIPALSNREVEEIERTGIKRVLLVGATESIVLDVDQLEQLSKEYVILGNHTVTHFLAARLDPSLGVSVVQRYWYSEPATKVTIVDD